MRHYIICDTHKDDWPPAIYGPKMSWYVNETFDWVNDIFSFCTHIEATNFLTNKIRPTPTESVRVIDEDDLKRLMIIWALK